MPGGRDFNTRRPPRRKSWDEEGQAESEDDGVNRPYRASDYDPKPEEPLFREVSPQPPSRSPSRTSSQSPSQSPSRSTSASRAAGRNGSRGSYGLDPDDESDNGFSPGAKKRKRDGFEEEKEEDAKTGRKRLFKLLGNEALCLLIIFGLIATFNWIATDYSGDYLGQTKQLRLVQLSLTRRATTIDAELNYGASGMLELDTGKDHPSPKENKAITLYFATPERWRTGGRRVWKAIFQGKIDGGKAVGTITDTKGSYKVSLEKNVLTSLFRQAQAHLPRLPEVPLPSLFDEDEKTKSMQPQNNGIGGVAPPSNNSNSNSDPHANSNSNLNFNSDRGGASNRAGGASSFSRSGGGGTAPAVGQDSSANGASFNGQMPPTNANNSGNLNGNPKWYLIKKTEH